MPMGTRNTIQTTVSHHFADNKDNRQGMGEALRYRPTQESISVRLAQASAVIRLGLILIFPVRT